LTIQDLPYVIAIGLIAVAIAVPLRSFLESRAVYKKLGIWEVWLREKPNLEEYLKVNNQSAGSISCSYCQETRIVNSLEMVTVANFQHSLLSNKFSGYFYWRSYNCSRCQNVLYRGVEEKPI
jgi:hypothetical protein